jgi:hypothetical protein
MKLSLTACLIFYSFSIFAQWNPNTQTGNIVCNMAGDKINQQSVSDGRGGIIIAFVNDWVDYDNNGLTTRTVNLQKLNGNGKLVWGTVSSPLRIDSVQVHNGGGIGYGSEVPLAMSPDGKGGVFIAWAHIYPALPPQVQHVDSSGSLQWGDEGVMVSSYSIDWDKRLVSICRSGLGVIVGWNGKKAQAGSQLNMFAQRLDEAGVKQWLPNGIQLADTAGTRAGMLVSDGNEGAIAFFMDDRNASKGFKNDIYSQRIDSNAARQWGITGKEVCSRLGDQQLEFVGYFQPEVINGVATADGEAIITFRDSRNSIMWGSYESNWDVYAQKLNGAGGLMWGADGVPVSSKTDNQFPHKTIFDSQGGISILFVSSVAPYLQRLKGLNGERQFGADGICVAPFLNKLDNNYASIAVNDSSAIFVSNFFNDWVPPAYTYLTVQQYDSTGLKKWDSTGFTALNTGSYLITNIVANPDGSVINSWSKTGAGTIHALKLNTSGKPFVDYTSITNGNWNDPATWSSGVVPNADSKVVINTIVTITADATCYSLQVGPGGQVIVAPGVHFTVLH